MAVKTAGSVKRPSLSPTPPPHLPTDVNDQPASKGYPVNE